MDESRSSPNGGAAWRPSLPKALVVASMVVALVAVAGLLYLLFTPTTGPDEVLREFIQRIEVGDCQGSHEMLDPSIRIDLPTWCEHLSELIDQVDARFSVREVVFEEDLADVRLTNPDGTEAVWRLHRDERSWGVIGPLTGVEFLV